MRHEKRTSLYLYFFEGAVWPDIYTMDSRFLVFWLEAFLCVQLSHANPENFVVSVNSNVSVYTNHAAILPCWLSPQQSAEDMKVHWFYSNQSDSPVMLYKDKTLSSESQPASYNGRVSFGPKHTSSAGLKEGDVTLKLTEVTLADAGKYTCYVSSDKHHDGASVSLFVRQTGAPPLLTAVMEENNKVNVSCESDGWHPEPQLQWSDGSRPLSPKGLVYRKASSGLLSVHSWIIVPSSSALSCTVGLPGEDAMQGRLRVDIPNSQTQEGSSVVGWALFALAAAIALALAVAIGLLFKKYRGLKQARADGVNDLGELEKLLPTSLSTYLDTAMKYYVNVTLEKSDNKYVKIANNKLRDNAEEGFPDKDQVTCITAVRGTQRFTGGKHYWEVSLVAINEKAEIPPKKSWWIGVTNRSENLNDCKLSPVIKNGFWFLSSSKDLPAVLQYSGDNYVGVSVDPRIIGVFLDYDEGRLMFVNVENKSIIGSFHNKFSGEVFPLFNPGKWDTAPMTIIHKNEPSCSSDGGTPDPQGSSQNHCTLDQTNE